MTMLPENLSECAFVDHELDAQFGGVGAAASERLRRHLAECARCRLLYQWMLETPAAPPTEAAASPELYRNISRALQSSARPVRALPSSATLFLQFAAMLALFAGLARAMAGVAGFRRMNLTQLSGMSAILLLGATLLAVSLVRQMIPGRLQRFSAKTILPALTTAFLLGVALLFPFRAPEAFLARGLHCLGLGLLMSVAVAIPFAFFARRGAIQRMGVMGATLGASAGLFSVAVLQFSCSHQDLGHLLVWHGLVLAASILLGACLALTRRHA